MGKKEFVERVEVEYVLSRLMSSGYDWTKQTAAVNEYYKVYVKLQNTMVLPRNLLHELKEDLDHYKDLRYLSIKGSSLNDCLSLRIRSLRAMIRILENDK